MTTTIRCDCGTNLKVPLTAAGKLVSCPKCQQRIRVPDSASESSAPTANVPPGGTSASSTSTTENDSILLACSCGASMKVAAVHVGKTVVCPKCNAQMTVPGYVVPPLPEVPPEPEPDIFGSLPSDLSSGGGELGGGLSGGGFSGGASMPPAYLKAAKKKRKPGVISSAGALVALIGIAIMAGGLGSCCIGLASFHSVIVRSLMQRESLESRFSGEAIREEMSGVDPAQRFAKMQAKQQQLAKERAAFMKTSEVLREIFKYGMKIGRTVLAVGGIVALVGYGISISGQGVQMALSIAAVIMALLCSVLDVLTRVIPWLSDGDGIPNDLFVMNIGSFVFRDNSILEMAGIEVLMAGHLLLFAIYALIGFSGRKNRDGAGFAITAITALGIYLLMILIIAIMLGDPSKTNSFMYMLIGVFWVANAAALAGMGYLIAALVKLR